MNFAHNSSGVSYRHFNLPRLEHFSALVWITPVQAPSNLGRVQGISPTRDGSQYLLASLSRLSTSKLCQIILQKDSSRHIADSSPDVKFVKIFIQTVEQICTEPTSNFDIFSLLEHKRRTHWSFNPPRAPHFGGTWDSAVKSVEFYLKRTVGENLLTFKELSTLLSQIEPVLNFHPLEPLSEDPYDLNEPGHFLIDGPLNVAPERSFISINVSWLTRRQLI